MPQFALNNMSSLASTATAAPYAAASSSSEGSDFEDHLQRASQGDPATTNRRDDPGPANGSSTENASAASSTSGDSNGQSAADSQPDSDSQSSRPAATPTSTKSPGGAENQPGHGTDPSKGDKSRSAGDKRDGAPDPSQPPAITTGLVATTANVQAATTTPAAPPVALTNAKPAPVITAAAKNPPANGAAAKQSTGENAALRPTSGTPLVANGSTSSAAEAPPPPGPEDAAKQVVGPANAGNQQSLQAVPASAVQVQSTNAAQPLSPAIGGSPSVAKSAADPSIQSAATSDAPLLIAEHPNSLRPAREVNSAKHSTASGPSGEEPLAAAVVATSTLATDPEATAASSTSSPRKESAPAAVDSIASKPPAQPTGQIAGQTAANSSIDPSGKGSVPSESQSAAGSGANAVDHVRFLQRVSSAFQAADQQGGQIRLRLSPPELGSMKLELTVRDGVMTAHVQTETDTARNMLLDQLPQLRDRLADHNIRIDHFDVELMNQSQTGTPQNPSGNTNPGYQPPQGQIGRAPSAGAVSASSSPSASLRHINGQLDVFV